MVSALLLLAFAATILATPLPEIINTRRYTITNKCPTAIDLYIGGVQENTIPTNGNVVKVLGFDAGFFYTNADGGNGPTASGTVRAGFYEDFYYMVYDPNHFNTGLQVKPSRGPINGFCPTIECDAHGCAESFTAPPTAFPNPVSTPPLAPYYRCPYADVGYDITFCPSGRFPPFYA